VVDDADRPLLRTDPCPASRQRDRAIPLRSRHDCADEPHLAASLYEQAFAGGLSGTELRRGLTSYGSTLRNLDRFDEAVAALERAHHLVSR
jgi:hypothetical protein